MNYNEILNKIDADKKSRGINEKLFRYSGLLQAIDFFSQQLNFDQVFEMAFDFVNELLTVKCSALYRKYSAGYILLKVKGIENPIASIEGNNQLKNLPVFHGTLLYGDELLSRYFGEEVGKQYQDSLAIPLIVETELQGFIFISGKTSGDFDGDDHVICEVLMKLFNNALNNYRRYEELQAANSRLDEKVFNLFAINQSSKALLSELSLDALYNLSVDVFSELTQSSVTGFVLYDEASENYSLKAFKDIFNTFGKMQLALNLRKTAVINENKVIIDTAARADAAYFNGLFEGGLEALADLRPKYLVLLVKNGRILGFVSLGSNVTGVEYSHGIFELIESLASSTYISISNALLFRQVNEQKRLVQKKFENLVSLNSLIRNVNSSPDVGTLLQLTLKTLDISFLVEKAMLALYDAEAEAFNISGCIGMDDISGVIKAGNSWRKVLNGSTVLLADTASLSGYFANKLIRKAGMDSGAIIVPIYIERLETSLLGVLIAVKTDSFQISSEEGVLLLETVAGLIAPVLGNLAMLEEQKKYLAPNYAELFKKALSTEIAQTRELSLEFEVLRVTDLNGSPFECGLADELGNAFRKVYPLSGNDVFIINNRISEDPSKLIADLVSRPVEVSRFIFEKDFSDTEGLLKILKAFSA